MTATSKTLLQAIVKGANGRQQSHTLESLSRLKLLPGSVVTVVDPSTGQAPKGLVLKRKGLDLVLELDGQGEVATLADFYSTPDLAFLPSGDLSAAGAPVAPAVTADTAAVGQTAAGESIVWKAPSAGFDGMGWVIAGGLGVAAAAGAGGGSGGSVAPASPPPPPHPSQRLW